LQAIGEELGPQHIDGLLRRWLARLPHRFTAQTVNTCLDVDAIPNPLRSEMQHFQSAACQTQRVKAG
jgi:hypothetical protein